MLETTRYNLSSQEMMSPANPVRFILPWEVGVAVDALAECWESDPGSVGQSLGKNLAILLAGASATSDT